LRRSPIPLPPRNDTCMSCRRRRARMASSF
jgi:hypothetical protein